METIKIKKTIYFLRHLFDLIISLIYKVTFKIIQKQFISFAVIGILGGLIEIILAKILMGIFRLDYQIAILLSIIISVIIVFFMNNYLTFRDIKLTGKRILKGSLKNLLMNSFIIFIRYALVLLFYSFLSLKLFFSQIIAIAICFLLRYIVSLKIIWDIN